VARENRTGKRFPLHLPVKVHKADVHDDHEGVTGNVSAAGVYIQADAALEVGSNVEFEITLPPEVTGGDPGIAASLKKTVWPWLEAGTVKPVVHQVFAAADAARAHELMESNRHIGKLVLTW